MRKPFIAGNWKMNLGCREARALAEEVRQAVKGVTDRDIAVFPTYVSVAELATLLDGTHVKVGGQNLYAEPDGAFTGEVSGGILRSAGATYVLVGHSERRHVLGEDDAMVNAKVQAALRHGLKPILCIGETLDEREAGRTTEVVSRHIRQGLMGIEAASMVDVVLAYEPVWAIGTGKTATPEMANEVHETARSLVESLFGRAVAQDLRIQYGGSVKPSNVDGLMAMPHIDGALVGGASLDAASFARIVRFE